MELLCSLYAASFPHSGARWQCFPRRRSKFRLAGREADQRCCNRGDTGAEGVSERLRNGPVMRRGVVNDCATGVYRRLRCPPPHHIHLLFVAGYHLSFNTYGRASTHGEQRSNQVTLPETRASVSSFEGSRARRFGIRRFGNKNSRILSFALWSWDLEFPMEQLRSAAISWC